MPRGVRQGNAVEVKVAKMLEAEGWIVGSRRHTGGAGDLLAVRRFYAKSDPFGNVTDQDAPFHEVRLIEVKATTQVPWRSTFGPVVRQAMIEAAEKIGACPWLVWWPPRGELKWISASDWPT